MSIIHWIRRPAGIVMIPAIVLGLLLVSQFQPQTNNMGIGSEALIIFGLLGPALALSAAWEAFRVSDVLKSHNSVKVILKGFISRVYLLLPIGIFGYLAGVLVLWKSGIPDSLGWTILLSVFHTLAWVSLGFSLGLVLPPIWGLTSATIIPFLLCAIPAGLEPGPIRHLFGVPVACCGLGSQLNHEMVYTSLLGLGAVCVASIVLLLIPVYRKLSITAFVVPAALVALGIQTASGIGVTAASPREASELHCAQNVCVWPELPEDLVAANINAFQAFQTIAPPEFSEFKENGVTWAGSEERNSLAFVGQTDEDAILAAYLGYALSQQSSPETTICGLPISIAARETSWSHTEPIKSVEQVKEKIEASCIGN